MPNSLCDAHAIWPLNADYRLAEVAQVRCDGEEAIARIVDDNSVTRIVLLHREW